MSINAITTECYKCDLPREAVDNILHQLSQSLGTAIDAKDPHTSLHSEEVAEISYSIALFMGLGSKKAEIIHVAGHLHDIGKIGVPDDVLKKSGPLSEEDWAQIRLHPEVGADILRPVDRLRETGIIEMVRFHHERFDGTGYPCGLKGTEIPLGARIITLADALSAMLQNRPYREAMSFEDGVREIVKNSGSQFDPDVVKGFLGIQEKVRSMLMFLNPG